jgi:hypothetical protein
MERSLAKNSAMVRPFGLESPLQAIVQTAFPFVLVSI